MFNITLGEVLPNPFGFDNLLTFELLAPIYLYNYAYLGELILLDLNISDSLGDP